MFEGVRDTLKKAASQSPPPLTEMIFPILTASELLSNERRQQLLKALPGLVQLPVKDFQANYTTLIHHFAEFVQSLPQTKDSYFSYSGGLLDHGLERAIRALTLSRSIIANQTGDPKELSHKQALLRYAVFSAALLFDVGFVTTKFGVDICDSVGDISMRWQPYQRAMVGMGTHYKFDYEKQNWDFLRGLVTPLVARQLMQINGEKTLYGFNWLSSDNEILETWLAMLKEESRQLSSLLGIIPLAEAQTIANYFDIDRPLQEGFIQPTANFWDNYSNVITNLAAEGVIAAPTERGAMLSAEERSRVEAVQPNILQETEKVTGTPVGSTMTEVGARALERRIPLVRPTHLAGLAFLRWVLRGVRGQLLSVNKANSLLHRINEGILLKNELFEQFAKENSQFKDAKQIRSQFAQFGFAHADQPAGMVIKNPYLIFVSGELPDINKNFKLGPMLNETAKRRPTTF